MITFRFFNMDQQDDEVARTMQLKEKQFLRATDAAMRVMIEDEYATLVAWFEGNTTRLDAAVTRVSGR